jgi:glycosyltransferase involved in cell wall biosynthesis
LTELNANCAKKNLPLVTIGVCVRNAASTIREAIESIIAQDYPHEFMEVIFVDDGSVDETLSIVKGYAAQMDIKVKIFHHEWRGLGFSRNVVVNNASGKYIVWVDGDMSLPEDHVSKQVEFMEKNPEIGIAKARYGVLPNESLIGFLENCAFVAADHIYGAKPTSRTLGTGGSIYRLKAIRQAGGFDVSLSGVGEDMEAENRVRENGWLLYLASPAVFYEQRRKSWRFMWHENVWHGRGGYSVFHRDKRLISLYKMIPLAGFLAGVWYATVAYRILRRKIVFVLPIHYALKRTAWCLGFFKSQLRGNRFATSHFLISYSPD